jgi:hypothetical protein
MWQLRPAEEDRDEDNARAPGRTSRSLRPDQAVAGGADGRSAENSGTDEMRKATSVTTQLPFLPEASSSPGLTFTDTIVLTGPPFALRSVSTPRDTAGGHLRRLLPGSPGDERTQAETFLGASAGYRAASPAEPLRLQSRSPIRRYTRVGLPVAEDRGGRTSP